MHACSQPFVQHSTCLYSMSAHTSHDVGVQSRNYSEVAFIFSYNSSIPTNFMGWVNKTNLIILVNAKLWVQINAQLTFSGLLKVLLYSVSVINSQCSDVAHGTLQLSWPLYVPVLCSSTVFDKLAGSPLNCFIVHHSVTYMYRKPCAKYNGLCKPFCPMG